MVRINDAMGIVASMKWIVLAAVILMSMSPIIADAGRGKPRRIPLPEAASLWFRADVTVTPDGRATDLSWRNYKEMPQAALGFLERRISGWRFRPGEVDGILVSTGTSLVIHVVVIERPDGRFGMEVAAAIPGPSLVGPVIKHRSAHWKTLARGPSKGGQAVLDVRFEPGRNEPVIEVVEFETSTENRRYVAALDGDSRWEVAQWQVRHETLDGVAVPAHFLFVNRYCYLTSWCDENAAETAAGLPDMPPRQPVPVKSAVELLTDVATVDILPGGLPEAIETD